MDIFINGRQGAGKTRVADLIVNTFSSPITGKPFAQRDILFINEIMQWRDRVRLLVETMRAAKARAVVFDECIASREDLLICVQAAKEYREQVGTDVLAIYCQQAELNILGVPDFSDTRYTNCPPSNRMTEDDFKDLTPMVAPATPEMVAEIEAYLAEGTPVPVELSRANLSQYPLTWDAGTEAYVAANLWDGKTSLVEAVNVYAFHLLGERVLFELDSIAEPSGLHISKAELNTNFFDTREPKDRAYNAKYCRPATPTEVMEYLNAKLKYQNSL